MVKNNSVTLIYLDSFQIAEGSPLMCILLFRSEQSDFFSKMNEKFVHSC
jgi:hypothetical protein